LGLLKIGTKRLFYHHADGTSEWLQPLCVLDFFVPECCQRCGIGRMLFDVMLADEGNIAPSALAIDRPSSKMMAFLRRHFGLIGFVEQPNKFVIYDQYFDT